MAVSAQDVKQLRDMTGAGMSDCKKALEEANGNFEEAIVLLRKKGQKISEARAGREAKEGAVFAYVSDDKKTGILIELNCETDFVARTDTFLQIGQTILAAAAKEMPADLEALKALQVDQTTIGQLITDAMARTGEKIELRKYEVLRGEYIASYIHLGARVGVLVAFENVQTADMQTVGRDVAMQVASMRPLAVDKDGVDASVIAREIEIGKEQARQEGKPESMLEKIAVGKLNKFYKESTLLNQDFVKDASKSIRDYLNEAQKGLTVIAFKRVNLGE